MESLIKIQSFKKRRTLTKKEILNRLSFGLLKEATVEEFRFDQGVVLMQSVGHYLACIQLFEYSFSQTTAVEFILQSSTFFMYADLNKGSCHLCFQSFGKYNKVIEAGKNQIMLITFKPGWLIQRCRKIRELRVVTKQFDNPENNQMNLPFTSIAGSLFRSLKNIDRSNNGSDTEDRYYGFINSCIKKYCSKLMHRNATTDYHYQKAAELSAFIKTHFATDEVENTAKLAARFMVSERTLARLAKIAFGIPLHHQVIRLRGQYAIKLLLTTDKPIFKIAALSGYKDAHYFSKAFKKQFGRCPKSIKRTLKIQMEMKLQA